MTPAPPRRPAARALLRVGAAVLLLAAVLWWADPRQVMQALAVADAAWLAAGLASAVAANLASALRWCALVRWLGGALRRAAAVGLYFRAVAINALLPGAVIGGDVYRAQAVARDGMPAMEAGLSVLFDRLSGLWMLVVIGIGAALWGLAADTGASPRWAALLPPAGWLAALGVLLWLGPLALLAALRRAAPTAAASRAPASASLPPWRDRLRILAAHPGMVAEYGRQMAASTAVQVLSIGTLWCGARALGLDLPWWAVAVAAVPTFLMATLPVSFGGWGTREAAAVVSLGAFGVTSSQAVAVSMLYGLAALAQAAAGVWLLVQARRPPTG